MLVSVEVDAGSSADDGMRLRHWIPFNAGTSDQLPSTQEVTKVIRQMAADLTALRSAPSWMRIIPVRCSLQARHRLKCLRASWRRISQASAFL